MSVPAIPADPARAEPGKSAMPSHVGGGGAGAKSDAGNGATGAPTKRDNDAEEDEWRHVPVAPVDEPNPLRSLGKAVGDTLTGSDQDTPALRKP